MVGVAGGKRVRVRDLTVMCSEYKIGTFQPLKCRSLLWTEGLQLPEMGLSRMILTNESGDSLISNEEYAS